MGRTPEYPNARIRAFRKGASRGKEKEKEKGGYAEKLPRVRLGGEEAPSRGSARGAKRKGRDYARAGAHLWVWGTSKTSVVSRSWTHHRCIPRALLASTS